MLLENYFYYEQKLRGLRVSVLCTDAGQRPSYFVSTAAIFSAASLSFSSETVQAILT